MRARALLIAVGLLVAGAPAPASAAADCAGVTVVVDFRALGGEVRTGCAAGDPGSGLAALSGAGFGYRMAQRFAGFVCRIDNVPESDPCVNASPTDAYWSYWHARPGGSWVYSDVGAAGRDPAPGAVEGWAFGAGGQPGVAPPAPAPARPEPTHAPPPQPTGQPGQPGLPGQPDRQGQPVQPGRSGEPAPQTGATTQPGSAEPTPDRAGATTATAESAGTQSAAPADITTLATGEQPGGEVGLLVGLAVIALLGALGWWTVRRRRQAGS
ncbi:hypothetical protein ACQPZF_20395 [Actinosynnema sp. CS-041913]|uniref:hypothetical protein n=1 Tax=Actinosynnema sp. CS-041913 TaxID=3239917 RepID=UPI003D8D1894